MRAPKGNGLRQQSGRALVKRIVSTWHLEEDGPKVLALVDDLKTAPAFLREVAGHVCYIGAAILFQKGEFHV